MTPRQIKAYSIFAERRIRIETANALNFNAIAARGESKYIGEITQSLMKER
jgi:hypothetical protein